ncbi:MAG: hypothetical protein JNK82_19585 [Myxococcaceae bacterium]|nr:hypothetical protein [Myxococcaceae bacterium]
MPPRAASLWLALTALTTGCLDWESLSRLGGTMNVPHLPPDGQFAGSADLTLGSVVVDTSVPEVRGLALPSGVTFAVRPHEPFGPELAVLHVRGLTVSAGAVVRVIGSRPLVVVAGTDIEVSGVLDASGRGDEPGAGAAQTRGAGEDGRNDPTLTTGGGGAGHSAVGAGGSNASATLGGEGGATYGDAELSVLSGGSKGGIGWFDLCAPQQGGAGGGAVQLFAAGAVRIRDGGGVNAGGGGGRGGVICNTAAAGSGGGSGGAIFVQANEVQVRGVLAANGGGGGSGTTACGGVHEDGAAGEDGTLGAAPARGGVSAGCGSAVGGSGGSLQGAALGGPMTNGAGGGGGGAPGRIRIVSAVAAVLDGVVSPAP